jgi:hypothetical protein
VSAYRQMEHVPWYEELAANVVAELTIPAKPKSIGLLEMTNLVISRLAPECYVCGKMIENIVASPSDRAREVTVRAWCHGMMEERVMKHIHTFDKSRFVDLLARTWFNATEFDPAWKGWQP